MDDQTESKKHIKVKFLARPRAASWFHQFPGNEPIWGGCQFSFDRDDTEYDWLVVYDDLPPLKDERRSLREEHLRCDAANTILVTTEPSSIKSYFSDYVNQFGMVLTSQPEWALPHPKRIYQQPALQWYYGVGRDAVIPFDEIKKSLAPHKKKLVSVVGSAKQQTHTLHAKRHKFITEVSKQCSMIDVYGKDYAPMDDKAEALLDYKFHLAVENEFSKHHWTEKLADTFLAEAVPIYFGCENIEDYFPPDSYIKIDINNPDEAVRIISSLSDKDYERRYEAVLAAKRKVLFEYNIFAVISGIAAAGGSKAICEGKCEHKLLKSRRAVIRQSRMASLRHLYEKLRLRLLHRLKSHQL